MENQSRKATVKKTGREVTVYLIKTERPEPGNYYCDMLDYKTEFKESELTFKK